MNTSNVNWIPLTSLEQLEEIKNISVSEPVLIFKHSTRCFTSKIVFKQFEKSFSEDMKHLKVYFLDLLSYRAVSNEIASSFQVVHQSPQLLVIQKGVAVAHASHYDITTINLKKYQ